MNKPNKKTTWNLFSKNIFSTLRKSAIEFIQVCRKGEMVTHLSYYASFLEASIKTGFISYLG